jgi:hypothetical protein
VSPRCWSNVEVGTMMMLEAKGECQAMSEGGKDERL